MSRLKQIDRRLLTILLIVFVQMLGASLILPILPLYAEKNFEMSPQLIALLVSSFFAAQFLAGPTIGRLSDKYGRLPVLIISQIGTVISFVMLGLATNVQMLFAARILDGITGGNIIVAQAYITDITPKEKRTESLGYVFAMFGLGFIFGPAVGSFLSAMLNERLPFIVAAVAALITVLITWRTLDETVTPEQREANRLARRGGLSVTEVVQNRMLMLVFLIAFVGQFSLGLLQATFALYGKAVLFAGYSEQVVTIGVGLLLTAVGLSQVFTQTFLLRRVLPKLGEAKLVIVGLIIRTLGLIIFAVITTPWLGPVASVLFAMGMGLMMPPLQSLATKSVSDNVRGGVLGLYQSIINLSIIISTAVGGVFFAMSPSAPYWIGTIISVVVLIPALLLLKRSQSTVKLGFGD